MVLFVLNPRMNLSSISDAIFRAKQQLATPRTYNPIDGLKVKNRLGCGCHWNFALLPCNCVKDGLFSNYYGGFSSKKLKMNYPHQITSYRYFGLPLVMVEWKSA